jgi:hypothetical protein
LANQVPIRNVPTSAAVATQAPVRSRRPVRSLSRAGMRAFTNATTTPSISESGRWYQANSGPTCPVSLASPIATQPTMNAAATHRIQFRRMATMMSSAPNR